MAASHNFKIDQGTDASIIFVLKKKDTPLDLTGYKAAMQVRLAAHTLEPTDTLTSENGRLVIVPTEGKITAKFPHSVTETFKPGYLVYDLEIQNSSGEIKRIVEGRIHVSAEVTRVSVESN